MFEGNKCHRKQKKILTGYGDSRKMGWVEAGEKLQF